MPKTGKNHHARKDELPSTLQRSDQKAQDTFAKTYDSAMETYDDEGRAARTAYASLKHSYEKVGDHWEAQGQKRAVGQTGGREGRRSHPRPRPEAWTPTPRRNISTKLARKLDVKGRSRMDKNQLVQAVQKANDAATRKARS